LRSRFAGATLAAVGEGLIYRSRFANKKNEPPLVLNERVGGGETPIFLQPSVA